MLLFIWEWHGGKAVINSTFFFSLYLSLHGGWSSMMRVRPVNCSSGQWDTSVMVGSHIRASSPPGGPHRGTQAGVLCLVVLIEVQTEAQEL